MDAWQHRAPVQLASQNVGFGLGLMTQYGNVQGSTAREASQLATLKRLFMLGFPSGFRTHGGLLRHISLERLCQSVAGLNTEFRHMIC